MALATASTTPLDAGLLRRIWIRIQTNRARHALYKRTLRELSNLSDRELNDLGIGRSMITRIATETAWGR